MRSFSYLLYRLIGLVLGPGRALSVVSRLSSRMVRSPLPFLSPSAPEQIAALRCLYRSRFAEHEFRTLLAEIIALQGLNGLDRIVEPILTASECDQLVEFDGFDPLRNAIQEGKGAILCSFHFGRFRLALGALLRKGFPLTVLGGPQYTSNKERGREFIHHPHRNLLYAARTLRRGGVVVLMLDGQRFGRGQVLSFLEHDIAFSSGVIRLARVTGAPIIPFFALNLPQTGTVLCRILEPIDPMKAEISSLISSCERFVRRFPSQWQGSIGVPFRRNLMKSPPVRTKRGQRPLKESHKGSAVKRLVEEASRHPLINLVSTIGARAVRYLFRIATAHMVGLGGMGSYMIGLHMLRLLHVRVATIGAGGPFEDGGADGSVHPSGSGVERSRSMIPAVLISLGVAASLFFLAGGLARLVFHNPDMSLTLRYLAVSIPLTALMSAGLAPLEGTRQKIYRFAVKDFLCPTVILLGTILLTSKGLGIQGLLLSHVMSAFIGAILAVWLALRFRQSAGWATAPMDTHPPGSLGCRIGSTFSIIRTLPMNLYEFMRGLIGKALSPPYLLLLALFAKPEEVGLLSVTLSIITPFVDLTRWIKTRSRQFLPSSLSQSQDPQSSYWSQLTSTWLMATLAPIVIFGVAFADPILRVIGDRFVKGTPLLQSGLLTLLIWAGSGRVAAKARQGQRHVPSPLQRLLTFPRVSAVASLVLIPRLGALGAVSALLVGVVIPRTIQLFHLWRANGLSPGGLWSFKPFVAGLVALLVVILIRPVLPGGRFLLPITAGSLYCCLYGGLLVALALRGPRVPTIGIEVR